RHRWWRSPWWDRGRRFMRRSPERGCGTHGEGSVQLVLGGAVGPLQGLELLGRLGPSGGGRVLALGLELSQLLAQGPQLGVEVVIDLLSAIPRLPVQRVDVVLKIRGSVLQL